MPSSPLLYFGAHLIVADLAPSITLSPIKKRGKDATKNAEEVHGYILKNGDEITEKAVAPRGMSGRLNMISDSESSSSDYLPFMMVRAGEELFKVQRENQLSAGQRSLLKLAKVKLSSFNPPSTVAFQNRDWDASTVDPDTMAEDLEQTQSGQRVQACLSELIESSKQANNRFSEGTDSCTMSHDEFKLTPAGSFLMKAFKAQANLHETIVKPHALGLVVQIKDKAFDAVEASKLVRKDLKMDVFFNGELADCIIVSGRGGRDLEVLKLLFTGRRTDRQVERPWVVVPHLQEPDGGIREPGKSKFKTATPQEQWDQVAIALLMEADKRGRDQSNVRPPTGRYLAAVSQLELPTELNDLQKHGNRKMGIIDVVVTLGVGRKNGPETCYLGEPERMIDTRYEEVKYGNTSTAGGTASARGHTNSPGKENIEPAAKRARRSSNQPEKTDIVTVSPQGVTSRTATPSSNSRTQWHQQSAAGGNTPFSQPNMLTPLPQWNVTMNTGNFLQLQSPSSIINSPSKTAELIPSMYHAPHSSLQSPLAPIPFSWAPGFTPVGANPFISAPVLRPAVSPTVQSASQSTWSRYQAVLCPAKPMPNVQLNSSPMAPSPSSFDSIGQSPDKTVSHASLNSSPSTASPSRIRGRKRKACGPSPASSPESKKGGDWPPIWRTPVLSQDSVITYAEVGENSTGAEKSAKFMETGEKAAVFRQIKSTRPGEFEEEEVQAGFRFLIL